MSHDEDNEVPPEELLVHGRSKRATAGNRMQFLMQHLDDEDVRNDLLAEDETDQLDYQLSDTEDVAFGSSDDSDDEGPPVEGQPDDLTGEKELQKQERADARKKKRKAHDFVKINPLQKRQRVDAPNSLLAPRPRKKSERISWLPTLDDAPTRQSLRRQTVANKEQTEAKLKESQKRSEKAHELMKIAAEKKAAAAAPALTQADRMARALKVEKENSKSLNRWEKAEEERQLAQKRRLEALRDRQLEGPVIRYWSGAVVWEGEKIKVKRVHQPKIELVEKPTKQKPPSDSNLQKTIEASEVTAESHAPGATQNDAMETPQVSSSTTDAMPAPSTAVPPEQTSDEPPTAQADLDTSLKDARVSTEGADPVAVEAPEGLSEPTRGQEAVQSDVPAPQRQPSFLDGIQFWASQSPEITAQKNTSPPLSTPAAGVQSQPTQLTPHQTQSANSTQMNPSSQALDTSNATTQPPDHTPQLSTSSEAHSHQPTHQTPLETQSLMQPQPPPAPLLREQAQRSLVILEAFPLLESAVLSVASKKSVSASAAISSILLPEALPNLTAQESKYLSSKSAKKKEFLPPPPPKPVCAITAKPARFRDPRTSIAYRDIDAYKALHKTVAGGMAWSSMLDCWMGVVGQGPMGRVARGVPECFWTGKQDKTVKPEEGQPSVEAAAAVPTTATPTAKAPVIAS